MVYGIGVDIIEIERIRRVIERKGDRFLKRMFTDAEISFCYARSNPYPGLAARFAAKEAVFKSLGTGLAGCKWTDVEVINVEGGKPLIKLSGNAVKVARDNEVDRVLISLSHDWDKAVAFAMAAKGGN